MSPASQGKAAGVAWLSLTLLLLAAGALLWVLVWDGYGGHDGSPKKPVVRSVLTLLGIGAALAAVVAAAKSLVRGVRVPWLERVFLLACVAYAAATVFGLFEDTDPY
jgi:hypothetical protein